MDKKLCELKDCGTPIGPGSSDVGFDNGGKIEQIRVCPKHSWIILTSPRGSYRIEPDRTFKKIPARRIII